MNGYPYEIRTWETDLFKTVPPSGLLKACVHGNTQQSEIEGLSAEKFRKDLDAVWMIAGARLRQSEPIYERDMLEVRVDSRGIEGCSYVRPIEVYKAGHKIAQVKLVYIAVRTDDRCILRPSAVEECWKNPRPLSKSEVYRKLKALPFAESAGSVTVRRSDCDLNGHLSAFNYLTIVCEALGYWEGEPKLAEFIQIDFRSELLPGETVSLKKARSGGVDMLRGVKENGITAFAAEYAAVMYK